MWLAPKRCVVSRITWQAESCQSEKVINMNFIVMELDEFHIWEGKVLCPEHGLVSVEKRAIRPSSSTVSRKGFSRGRFYGVDRCAEKGVLSCGCEYAHDELLGFKELHRTYDKFYKFLSNINKAFDDVEVDESGHFECSDTLEEIYEQLQDYDKMQPWIEFEVPFSHKNLELLEEINGRL